MLLQNEISISFKLYREKMCVIQQKKLTDDDH